MGKFIMGNYYLTPFPAGEFDGVITDPPYAGAIKNRLNEQSFDTDLFMQKTDEETKDVSFLITFCNFLNAVDFVVASRRTKWMYHTVQIWDKRPTATLPLGEGGPRRHTEYILYFKKGTKAESFKYKFLTGDVKAEGYARSSIGIGGMYQEKGRKGADVMPALSRYDDVLTIDEIEGMDVQQEGIQVAQFTGKKVDTSDKRKDTPRVKTDFVVAASGDIIKQVIVSQSQKLHQVHKPQEFSYYFSKIVGGTSKYVLDPFCGSTSLLTAFKNGVGVDLKDWRSGEQYMLEKKEIEVEGEARAARKAAKASEGGVLEAKHDNKFSLGVLHPSTRLHAKLSETYRTGR